MYDQITANKLKSTLLVFVFVVLVGAVGWAFGEWSGWGTGGLFVALAVAAVMSIGSYWYSDQIVLKLSKARPVNRETEPYVVNTIEGLAIAAGLPVPKVYIIDDTAPNAFATGRDPEHAAIALTAGIVSKLDRLELEGVIAHELAHVKNYDIRLQTLTAVLAGTIALLSDWMLRSMWWGGMGRNRRDEGGGQFQVIIMVIALVLMILAPIAAAMIQMAISRKREYLADASGALLTRYPAGLAGALRKISADTEKLEVANKATEPLYIANPLKDHGGGMNAMFSTHPPIEERIKRLEAM